MASPSEETNSVAAPPTDNGDGKPPSYTGVYGGGRLGGGGETAGRKEPRFGLRVGGTRLHSLASSALLSGCALSLSLSLRPPRPLVF